MKNQAGSLVTFVRAGACILLAGLALAGCSGKDGSVGATGPTGSQGPAGPPGPTGPVLALDISTAKAITGTITNVTSGNAPVVTFSLVDEVGNPLKGLKATDVRLAIAQLQPMSADTGGSTQWRNYLTTVAKPAAGVGWGKTPTVQATAEAASTAGATFTDNGDGTYKYTFSKDLPTLAAASTSNGVALTYDGTLTHRVGFEIRGTGLNPTNNPVYDYLPSSGATTGLATRSVVSDKECDACHAKLALHGGPRIDVQYCVLCHNSGTTDPESGNTVDFKVLVHKIHSGAKLPSVVADKTNHGLVPAPGIGYVIFGFGGSVNNFNSVVWPQDTRNCTTCHNTTDANTPDAGNYQAYANTVACGSCHDTINFTTGAGHGPANIVATDKDCASSTCHGPTSTVASNGVPLAVVGAHVIPQLVLAQQFKFTVVKVESVQDAAGTIPGATACAAAASACTVLPGEYPKVTLKISNPQNGNLYALTDAPFTNTYLSASGSKTTARVRGRVAYTTLNYTNRGANTGTAATQAGLIDFIASPTTVKNADGTYTAVAARPLPPTGTPLAGGSGAISVEGRAIMNLAPTGQPVVNGNVPITSADPVYFPISDAKAVARRDVVDSANCLRCHKSLQLHGDARNNKVQLCVMCHNPAQAPRVQATGQPAGSSGSEPVDFKFFIHSLHAGNYKFGVVDLSEVGFPGALNNCLGCHKTDTYYPVDPAVVFATSIDAGPSAGYDDPTQHIAITANAAACGACHVDHTAQLHMKQNGAVIITDQFVGGLQFGAPNVLAPTAQYIKAADGSTLPQFQTETCVICHGPGATADVKVVHHATDYKFN
jgi:OmcA/MtrC family decaheme c-type cytochrome